MIRCSCPCLCLRCANTASSKILESIFRFPLLPLLKMLCKGKIFFSADDLLSLRWDSSAKWPLRKLTLCNESEFKRHQKLFIPKIIPKTFQIYFINIGTGAKRLFGSSWCNIKKFASFINVPYFKVDFFFFIIHLI